jgi:hypothetical protein
MCDNYTMHFTAVSQHGPLRRRLERVSKQQVGDRY